MSRSDGRRQRRLLSGIPHREPSLTFGTPPRLISSSLRALSSPSEFSQCTPTLLIPVNHTRKCVRWELVAYTTVVFSLVMILPAAIGPGHAVHIIYQRSGCFWFQRLPRQFTIFGLGSAGYFSCHGHNVTSWAPGRNIAPVTFPKKTPFPAKYTEYEISGVFGPSDQGFSRSRNLWPGRVWLGQLRQRRKERGSEVQWQELAVTLRL